MRMHQPGTNLPPQLTSFIGRERDIAEVKRLLGTTRLLTLTGAGGGGKTRLAMEVAGDLASAYEDGVWWVELAGLSDHVLVPQAVASALGIREVSTRPLAELLVEYLRPRKVLLVLDNCEHLVDACARLAESLLRPCSGLQILATSRELLNIPSETAWPVPPLSFPTPDALAGTSHESEPLAALQHFEAVRLFVERASGSLPSFDLSQHNAAAVVEICRRLDGMPLAIELAAARVRSLGVEAISERLDDAMRLLTAGSRTALPRHQTLRATIQWSYDLLSEQERCLLHRLAVFAGGFTIEAAEQVAGFRACPEPVEGLKVEGSPSVQPSTFNLQLSTFDVLDLLANLVDKSLVEMPERGGKPRYRLLEMIRQYAWAQLRPDELAGLRQTHALYFLDLAEQVEPNINTADRSLWLERLEVEYDNLRAALQWGIESGRAEIALRVAGALWWFWFHRGYWSEGRTWLARVLELPAAAAPTPARGKALTAAGLLAFAQGDYAASRGHFDESVAVYRTSQEKRGLGYALAFAVMTMVHQGEAPAARVTGEEAVALLRDLGDPWGLAVALTNLGVVGEGLADYALAQSMFEASLAAFQQLGDRWGISLPLRHLGVVAFRQGDYARAAALYKASLALAAELGDRWFGSMGLEDLAVLTCLQGADYRRAALLLGASAGQREALGTPVRALYRPDYERAVASAKAALSEDAFATAWAQGHALNLEQAIAYALDEPAAASTAPVPTHDTTVAEPESQPPPQLRIYGFGPARVLRDEEMLAAADWSYAKPKELLFYLLSHPSRTKEQIGLTFWPDASPAQLRSSFHVTLHHLRRALGRPEWIVFEHNRYAFNRSLAYWFDVEVFESNVTTARRLQATAPREAIDLLGEAVRLYAGDFLEDFDEGDWYLLRREELRRMYLDALLALGQLTFAQGDYAQAAGAYRQAIAHDNLLETAHRELMRCYAQMGETGQALRQYQVLVELLREELDAAPDRETSALFERLRTGIQVT